MKILYDLFSGYWTGRPWIVIDQEDQPAIASFRTEEEARRYMGYNAMMDRLIRWNEKGKLEPVDGKPNLVMPGDRLWVERSDRCEVVGVVLASPAEIQGGEKIRERFTFAPIHTIEELEEQDYSSSSSRQT